MASHDAMNREDGDADHVAVTQSDMTRAASAALQAAAAQGSAGQRPSLGVVHPLSKDEIVERVSSDMSKTQECEIKN